MGIPIFSSLGSDAVLSVKLSTGTVRRLFFTVADTHRGFAISWAIQSNLEPFCGHFGVIFWGHFLVIFGDIFWTTFWSLVGPLLWAILGLMALV